MSRTSSVTAAGSPGTEKLLEENGLRVAKTRLPAT